MPRRAQPIEQRFWRKVIRGKSEECWLWAGAKWKNGYGNFCITRMHSTSAHRFSYMLAKGPIPKGKLILHSCDNPPCCNPQHLKAGTQKDNALDAVSKGRWNTHVPHPKSRGEENHAAKLTERDVLFIRGSTLPTQKLADKFGVAKFCIFSARNGLTWKHIKI